MRLHTGETQSSATANWDWEQRKRLGQRYLQNLSEDILVHLQAAAHTASEHTERFEKLKRSLELDGYVFRDGVLMRPESDVLDVQEEAGVLQNLYSELALGNDAVAFHHLKLSEDHYMAERWDDCISNSRKFLECVMQESAAKYSLEVLGKELETRTFERPVHVRDYLESKGLLESKEKEAISRVYGLLSHTGSHPYMAQDDQARLLRHLALTLSQFVLLRLKGSLSGVIKTSP